MITIAAVAAGFRARARARRLALSLSLSLSLSFSTGTEGDYHNHNMQNLYCTMRRFVNRFVNRFANRCANRFVNRFANRFVNRSMDRSMNRFIVHYSAQLSTGTLPPGTLKRHTSLVSSPLSARGWRTLGAKIVICARVGARRATYVTSCNDSKAACAR